jgi:hypothetical protein
MRTVFLITAMLIIGVGCSPRYTSGFNSNPSNIAVIKVEFKKEDSVKQTIVQLLKTSRIMEMETSYLGSMEIIVAKYDNIPGGKVQEIEQLLMQTTGVIDVTVKWEELQVPSSRRSLPPHS